MLRAARRSCCSVEAQVTFAWEMTRIDRDLTYSCCEVNPEAVGNRFGGRGVGPGRVVESESMLVVLGSL